MKLRVLKKKLKQNCNYYETEHTSLVIEQKQAIPVKIKNKIRWKNKRGTRISRRLSSNNYSIFL